MSRILLLLAASLTLNGVPAWSQDSGTAQQSVGPDGQPSATASGGAPADPEVTPGPLEEARKMLWARIKQAKSEGIGTGAYVQAFRGIEEQVKTGQPADALRPRIETLARALKDQLDRGKILKTQRPIPPTPSQQMGGGAPAPSGGAAGLASKLGGKDPTALLEKLKQKLNSGDIPDGLKDQILNSDQGKKILEKLSQ